MFKAGQRGLFCAAYEVAIERGDQDREGSIRPIQQCPNLATELWRNTGLCADCFAVLEHADISVARNLGKG